MFKMTQNKMFENSNTLQLIMPHSGRAQSDRVSQAAVSVGAVQRRYSPVFVGLLLIHVAIKVGKSSEMSRTGHKIYDAD